MTQGVPNYFDDPESFSSISFGGVPIVACALTKIDDLSTTDQWQKQKSKETSGSVKSYSGTTVDDPKLTFEAPTSDAFNELRALWQALKPAPGQGAPSVPTTATSTAGASYGPDDAVGSPSAADGDAAAAEAGLNEIKGNADNGATTATTGPRPPTVSVQNGFFAWHGITSVARGKWDGPYETETKSLIVHVTFVPQDPPKPAGAGAMAPATGTVGAPTGQAPGQTIGGNGTPTIPGTVGGPSPATGM